ncbi:MAG: hypothetical protein L0Z55_06825 [Planctomycetes bacterium]|nr:hypothetical protein [Planctomycetota bacterium]
MTPARSGAASLSGWRRPALLACAALAVGCAAVAKDYSAAFGTSFGLAAAARKKESAREEAGRLLASAGQRAGTDLSGDRLQELATSNRLLGVLRGLPADQLRELAALAGIPAALQEGTALAERTALGLQLLFAPKPQAKLPASIAFVEANTGVWTRLMLAGAGAEAPATPPAPPAPPLIRSWSNATEGAAGAESDLDRLRAIAARLRADLLVLVEYDWSIEPWKDAERYLIFFRKQRIQSKVQASVVDTRTGIILGVFEAYASDAPAPALFRSATVAADGALAEQRSRLASDLWLRLRDVLATLPAS